MKVNELCYVFVTVFSPEMMYCTRKLEGQLGDLSGKFLHLDKYFGSKFALIARCFAVTVVLIRA